MHFDMTMDGIIENLSATVYKLTFVFEYRYMNNNINSPNTNQQLLFTVDTDKDSERCNFSYCDKRHS